MEVLPSLPRRRQRRKLSLSACMRRPEKPPELTDEEFAEIMTSFNLIDANEDGRISKKELRDGAFLIGLNPTPMEINKWWKFADVNGDGFISCEEYVNVMKLNYVSIDIEQERMAAAFAMFDRNGDGCISLKELRTVLKFNTDSISDKDIDELFKEIDVQGKGYIDFNDFVTSTLCAKVF